MNNLKCKVCGSDTILMRGEIYECSICGSHDFFDANDAPVQKKKGLSKNKVLEIVERARELHSASRYREEVKLLLGAVETADDKHAILYVSLGRAYRTVGLIDEAIECYEKAIEINPYEGMAYNNLGAIHLMRENYAAADKCYEYGLRFMDKANGDYWVSLANHAIAVAKLGNPAKAKFMIAQAELHGYKKAETIRKLAGIHSENSIIGKINDFFTRE